MSLYESDVTLIIIYYFNKLLKKTFWEKVVWLMFVSLNPRYYYLDSQKIKKERYYYLD